MPGSLRTARRSLIPLALAGLLLATAPTEAAPELPCLPDCPDTPWEIPTQTAFYTLPSGCYVQVGYAVRHAACGQFHDVGIKWIAPWNTQDPACASLQTMPIGQLLEMITLLLLEENPMGFPPENPGECNTNWRVVRGSCWSRQWLRFGVNPAPSLSFRPCSETACCLKPYRVCRDLEGKLTVTARPYFDYGPCPGAVPPSGGVECEPVCN